MTKPSSSSSEGDERYAAMDEKKRRRMISNRESARRSRMRREQHIKDLTNEITLLKSTNVELAREVDSVSRQALAVELDNRVLARRREELARRLDSLEMVSSYVCGQQRERDSLQCNSQQPWQLPQQPMPLIASVGMLQF
ncbi:hypothetical protein NMG60_11025009 [Bertholletia excelsa]